MSKFARLQARINKAERDMEMALQFAFPVLSKVDCWIMSSQSKPSTGEVIAYPGGHHAYLRVRLDSRTRQVRDIPVFLCKLRERVA